MAVILHLEETTSTNDVATALGKQSALNFTCVRANVQTKGRGRMGKVWRTYPNTSLAFSLILRVEKNGEQLPLALSLAVCEALQKYAPCTIKWPNDVLLNGEKVCGILVERIANEGNSFYVAGIGVNVNMPENETIEVGVCLQSQLSKPLDNEVLFLEICEKIKDTTKVLETSGWCSLMEHYKKLCSSIGEEATIRFKNEMLTGIVRDVDENGALHFETTSGLKTISSGEIIRQGTEEECHTGEKTDTPSP